MTSKEKAVTLAAEIADKKGTDIQVFDLRGVCSFTDFFVIATGTSNRHVKTLANATLKSAREHGERRLGIEGSPRGRWILVDLADVVVHLFEREAREFYALERLWSEAELVELPPFAPGVAEAAR